MTKKSKIYGDIKTCKDFILKKKFLINAKPLFQGIK